MGDVQPAVRPSLSNGRMGRSGVYLVCGGLFAAVALAGLEYGALPWYAIPAALFAFQFARPTRLGWAACFLLSAVASGGVLFLLLRDLAAIASGGRPSVLVDRDDSLAFVALTAVLVTTTAWLLGVRPAKPTG